jgi:drug/metabolite transporter (DMT)-like permease
VSYTLILHAMETAPVSYITAARQSSVLFALLIAVVALKERPGRLRVLGGIANVAGVVLIALAR